MMGKRKLLRVTDMTSRFAQANALHAFSKGALFGLIVAGQIL